GQTSLVAGVTTWSQAQADGQFKKDIAGYVNAVNSYFTRFFNQNQFDAMVSFTYNCGTGVFERDNWDKNASNSYVTESIANYINKGTIFEEGLRRRRQEEINLFNTPVNGNDVTIKKGEEDMMFVYTKVLKTGGAEVWFVNGGTRIYLPTNTHVREANDLVRRYGGSENLTTYNYDNFGLRMIELSTTVVKF
ncbi:lysozyme, partial [Enterococcus caccae]